MQNFVKFLKNYVLMNYESFFNVQSHVFNHKIDYHSACQDKFFNGHNYDQD